MESRLWLFGFIGGIGLLFIIYSIISRKRITLFTKYSFQDYKVVNEEDFLKVQLYTGIISGIVFLVTAGIGYLLFNCNIATYIIVYFGLFAFHLINYFFLLYSLEKGYIEKILAEP